MIVRLLNEKRNSDKFFDCVRSDVFEETLDPGNEQPIKRFYLVTEFEYGGDCTFELSAGDEIYYMNNAGKTIARDLRFKNT